MKHYWIFQIHLLLVFTNILMAWAASTVMMTEMVATDNNDSPDNQNLSPTTTRNGVMCYSCTSNDDSSGCALASNFDDGDVIQCHSGENCWTTQIENGTYYSIERGCMDDACSTDHSDGVTCVTSNDEEKCTHCCDANKCNNEQGSSAWRFQGHPWLVTITAPLVAGIFSLLKLSVS